MVKTVFWSSNFISDIAACEAQTGKLVKRQMESLNQYRPMVHGPKESALPEIMLEVQILGTHPGLLNQNLWWKGPGNCLNKSSRWCLCKLQFEKVCSELRMKKLELKHWQLGMMRTDLGVERNYLPMKCWSRGAREVENSPKFTNGGD